MAVIQQIHAYEIIDSRGFPTLEGNLILDSGQSVTTSIPAGTSIGKYECVELRDQDTKRFFGMGVSQAVTYINTLIAPKLKGISPLKQNAIDNWLINADGTKNKSKLGANTILCISQLVTKAAAVLTQKPLFKYINELYASTYKQQISLENIPTPIFNIINGGKHANNNLDFQEFQIIPSSAFSFSQAYQTGVEIFHELKNVLLYRNAIISVGEEGGFTPNFATNNDAIEAIKETLNQKKLQLGVDIFLGLDVAASHFYKNERYVIKDKAHPLKVNEFIGLLLEMCKNNSILILEDPLNDDDWDNWKKITSMISRNIYLVGDDLLVTNKERLSKAIKEHACTTVLIKPNQIGTMSETLDVVHLARSSGFNCIVSHRSGETNDDFLADFAVAIQADFVKFGAPSRGERVAKYNRLWNIERQGLK